MEKEEEGRRAVGAERDLLHPLAMLDWEHSPRWKGGVRPKQCAVLHDTIGVLDAKDRLHISTNLHSWTTARAPYNDSSLTTYNSKFVLVGGRHPSTHELTNQLLSSTTGLDWKTLLPVMPTSRSDTSSVSGGSPEVLVVVGGRGSDYNDLDVVEVLLGNLWTTAGSLPTPCLEMLSTFHEENFYFTSRYYQYQNNILYTCSYDLLTDKTAAQLVWRKMTVPDYTTAIASYSSRLISIDFYSTLTSYSTNTQKWVEPTSVGDVSHVHTMFTCLAALSTGQLVIANNVRVYRVTPSVTAFNPDTRFSFKVLSRLEAVMGVHIESKLATMIDLLTSTTGVILQTRRNKRNKMISLPDPQKDPVQYVQEVILQWSMGHSPRSPTWRELLQVIQDMGLLELRQQIENFMKGEVNYLEAYNYFVHTKESITLLFLKVFFVGPSQFGKTTLCRRLLKEIIDLISAGEADKSQPSTGVVESSNVIVSGVSSTTAVITGSEESEWSKLADLVDEARMLVHSLMSTVKNTHASTPFEQSSSSPPVTSKTQQLPTPVPSSGTSSSHQEARALHEHISKASTILGEVMGSDHWKNVKQVFKAYIRIEDTGGQPELMDMLSALTLGPGLYLFFINLQNDLNHHYKLTYCNAFGESTPAVESVYSVKETLLSSLSSIFSTNACSAASQVSASGSYLENTQKSSKSVAYIVGTHKDKVSNEHIKKINDDLKKVIMPTKFYKQDIVQFASEEDLIVSIDNMAGGAEEVKKVKKLLEGTMTKHFMKLKIPAVWLFFSLFLRQIGKRTVSIDYCMQLSSTLGMSVHETSVSLWFLHHHAGVLMYFPNVPELKDLVIIDVQVVYDSVTFLILQAKSREKIGHSAAKDFKNTGQFTKSCIIAATCEICGDHIQIDKLVALLEFLHIIARVASHHHFSSSILSSQEEATYIMPCILRNATREQLNSITQEPQEIPPLLFYFTCGSVPIGLFPALISCLITTESFTLIHDEIYKNMIKFYYGSSCTSIVFSCFSTFYQISIMTCTENVKLHVECNSIRKSIMSIIPKVTSRFNYGSQVDYLLAFDCPIHPNCSRQHFCVIHGDEYVPQMMKCLKNADNPHPVKLSDCHKQWFGQIPMTLVPSTQEHKKSSQAPGDKECNLTLKTLSLLKRKREDECTEKLRIIQEVCPEWKKMGDLMGLSASRLTAIEMNTRGIVEQCCRDVFKCWLEKEVEGDYPVTWQGLRELLEDMELCQLVEQLKQYISM